LVIAEIADDANELWFSVASIWEMGIKVAIGKLRGNTLGELAHWSCDLSLAASLLKS
jgi:PIN domain nuclease of toxin-antitoxin system